MTKSEDFPLKEINVRRTDSPLFGQSGETAGLGSLRSDPVSRQPFTLSINAGPFHVLGAVCPPFSSRKQTCS